jgi:hypothetical protein
MEQTINTFEIIKTSNGYMINYMTENGDMQSLHAPDGDNTFDDYGQAVIVLTQYLLKELLCS